MALIHFKSKVSNGNRYYEGIKIKNKIKDDLE